MGGKVNGAGKWKEAVSALLTIYFKGVTQMEIGEGF